MYRMLGFYPNSMWLYEQAFTHRSSHNTPTGKHACDNERLEFLGDAVLGIAVADILYKHFPNQKEGFLTSTRSKIVQRETLNRIALEMGLDKMMVSTVRPQTHNSYILGNALEALIGAIYLDGGIEAARNHIERFILTKPKSDDQFHDYKSALQELVQEKQGVSLHYELCKEEGPEHEKVFTTAVCLNGRKIGEGEGRSKKESEQRAAYQAVTAIQNGTVCI